MPLSGAFRGKLGSGRKPTGGRVFGFRSQGAQKLFQTNPTISALNFVPHPDLVLVEETVDFFQGIGTGLPPAPTKKIFL